LELILASHLGDISLANMTIQAAFLAPETVTSAQLFIPLPMAMAGSQIKSWGMRFMRTKGRRRAVVAVARKLAVFLHRMWTDGTEFRPEKVEGMA
jgi:hypothetical protein